MAITNKISAEVVHIEQLCSDTKSFFLKPEKRIMFKAGQFVMLNIPYKNTFVRRAYSIANAPGGEEIELCLNLVPGGKASEFLFGLKGGEKIEFDGPYGIFVVRPSEKDKVFIATGTGVAPLRSMILDILNKDFKGGITLVFGERTREELLYDSEFRSIADENDNFEYVPTLSNADNGWKGERGYVQNVMGKHVSAPKDCDFYICGMKEMVREVKEKLVSAGVSEKNIFTERFG